jgi:putative ABC transport system substrate-binding protein
MKRREFISLIGGAAAATWLLAARQFIAALGGAALTWPRLAAAQSSAKTYQVGFLFPGAPAVVPAYIAALQSALQASGLRAEQVEIVQRIADGNPALLASMAADLVARKVDLIEALSPAAVRAARTATATIPIVAVDLESDPVDAGFAASNTQPGGNITGMFLNFPDFSKKWLEALKEAVPQVTSVAVFWDPATGPIQLKSVEEAAQALNLKLVVLQVRQPADIEPAFRSAVQKSAGALLMLSTPLLGSRAKLVADLALEHRLAAITLFPVFAREGGLMAYGPNVVTFNRQAGVMAAKILLGANPAELPIETPAKFEFVLNLKTAKALGLIVPASVLLRADEVIE